MLPLPQAHGHVAWCRQVYPSARRPEEGAPFRRWCAHEYSILAVRPQAISGHAHISLIAML